LCTSRPWSADSKFYTAKGPRPAGYVRALYRTAVSQDGTASLSSLALIGYLLTCPRTGARPGSVQVPGPSLSLERHAGLWEEKT